MRRGGFKLLSGFFLSLLAGFPTAAFAQSVWTSRVSGTTAALYCVTESGTLWIAAGQGGTLLTSPDGATWTARNSGTQQTLYSVVWTGAQWVAVGDSGAVLTSPDGVSWTARYAAPFAPLNSVAWTGSKLVAVGGGGIANFPGTLLTSSDGITWTAQNTGTTYARLQSVAWADNQVVAAGYNGTLLTSPDGLSWTKRVSPTFFNAQSATWTGSQWVTVGDFGVILTSPDGINWTRQASGLGTVDELFSVAWMGNQLVAVGSGNSGGYDIVLTSADGVNWTSRLPGTASVLTSVAGNGSQWVVVSGAGTLITAPNPLAIAPRASRDSPAFHWSASRVLISHLPGKTPVTLRLSDIQGRVVFQGIHETDAAGNDNVSLPATLGSAFYSIDVRAGTFHETARLLR